MAGKPESLIIALMFAFLGIFIGQDLHRLLCTWTDLRESANCSYRQTVQGGGGSTILQHMGIKHNL